MASGRRRRFISWFVEPYRQIKIGLIFLIVNFSFSFSILGLFGYYFYDVYSAMKVYFDLSQAQSNEVLAKFALPIYAAFFLIALFVLVTLLVSVRYTYAIYGPLVSIHRFLDEILAGRMAKPLYLRESDQLKDLAEKLNVISLRLLENRNEFNAVLVNNFLDDLIQERTPSFIRLRETDSSNELVEKLNRVREILEQK
jgi:hypothetical protein